MATRREFLSAMTGLATAAGLPASSGEPQPAAKAAARENYVIDCHGHYTTAPPQLDAYRKRQIAALMDPSYLPVKGTLGISDDEIRDSVEGAQLRVQRERGTALTLFSPRASAMGHHIGNFAVSNVWSQHCNELIHRVCTLYPDNFAGSCQLPQSPGVPPATCIPELERCVKQFGFVGCNLNPDPSGGYWTDPPLTDKWWHPLYEKLVELDVPAMIHVSASVNPNFHALGAHYIAAVEVADGDRRGQAAPRTESGRGLEGAIAIALQQTQHACAASRGAEVADGQVEIAVAVEIRHCHEVGAISSGPIRDGRLETSVAVPQ